MTDLEDIRWEMKKNISATKFKPRQRAVPWMFVEFRRVRACAGWSLRRSGSLYFKDLYNGTAIRSVN
jgi:hypothetical protein